uniref:F-box domain-containing protein n=1 Tax=Amphimedon queenslandica TaxID=400682 RepID=A0A1X7U9I8_AMPQE
MDSLPVPLLIQCLLYLIGNLFDDDDKPIPGLALLPRSIRIKLLLLLPAVDVHKLEGTSVTADILMDEIWETLYKERNHDRQLDKHNSLFSCKDLYFSTAMVDSYLMFYGANKELSVYFTHVKKSVYNDYKIATFHNVIWARHKYRLFVTTKTFKSKAIIDHHYDHLKALALTMIDLNISLKIVSSLLLELDHEILKKLTQSAEAIHWIWNCTDIEKFFKIIFIENKCRIISCICEASPPLLLLDYLQQQCDLKILDVAPYFSHAEKFKEVVKCHKNLEVVSVMFKDSKPYDFFQELMYRSCFQELNIKTNYWPHESGRTPTCNAILSAFFLSPYPVTLRLGEVLLAMDSTRPTPGPLAINTEQQSKSLDVNLEFSDRWHDMGCNFLPQYIVLKLLRIRGNDALCLFSKVKSIKVDEITIDIDTDTNTNSLKSLINIVSTNDMKIVICYDCNLHHSTLALEIIFNSLSPTKLHYLQLIVEHSGDDPSPILYDTWKRCGAIKLKKAVIVDEYGQEKEKYLEEM